MKAVITGDIINSTAMPTMQRVQLPLLFSQIMRELERLSPCQYEIFRGDSFQIVVSNPEEVMTIAILLRAKLISLTSENAEAILDARIAIGIGNIEYRNERISTSDGEAFHYSGREFDHLGKRNLALRTRWIDVNEEFNIVIPFVDDIINNWTPSQAKVIYMSLLENISQKEIAFRLNTSAQNISKISTIAREKLIRNFLNRFYQVIISQLT